MTSSNVTRTDLTTGEAMSVVNHHNMSCPHNTVHRATHYISTNRATFWGATALRDRRENYAARVRLGGGEEGCRTSVVGSGGGGEGVGGRESEAVQVLVGVRGEVGVHRLARPYRAVAVSASQREGVRDGGRASGDGHWARRPDTVCWAGVEESVGRGRMGGDVAGATREGRGEGSEEIGRREVGVEQYLLPA